MAKLSPMMLLPIAVFAGFAGMAAWALMRDNPDVVPSAMVGREAPSVGTTTLRALESAAAAGVRALVVLSTDKAVYPVNAMGMSKALMEKTAQAFSSLVGTHVVCQVQMGPTRDKLAGQLGKRKIAWRSHEDKAQVHEESRALISSGELTDRLGFRKGKRLKKMGLKK